MRKSIIPFVIIGVFTTAVAGAVSLSVGAGYFFSTPLEELTLTRRALEGLDYPRVTTDGFAYKTSLLNFEIGAVINLIPWLSLEATLEKHVGYNNKADSFAYYDDYPGGSVVEGVTAEDESRLKILAFGGGLRFDIPVGWFLKPFVDAGYLYSKAEFEHDHLIEGYNINRYRGNHHTMYFGGGVRLPVTDGLYIALPVKYRYYFSAPHKQYLDDVQNVDLGLIYHKLPGILSISIAVEYSVM